jgi:hypothetical protein
MGKYHVHESHPEIVKRLKRATGHLQTIITMIESHRSCLELAQQLHAVEKAMCGDLPFTFSLSSIAPPPRVLGLIMLAVPPVLKNMPEMI